MASPREGGGESSDDRQGKVCNFGRIDQMTRVIAEESNDRTTSPLRVSGLLYIFQQGTLLRNK